MGWGLDAHWGALAARARLADRRHRRARPSATCARSPPSYPRDAAIAEAEAFLDGRAVRDARRGRRDAGEYRALLMRVVVVAEYYPRAADPVLGVWAHRQALAARDGGRRGRACSCCTVRCRRRRRCASATRGRCSRRSRQPLQRARSTASRSPTCRSSRRRGRAPTARWGAWAAPTLALALRRLRRRSRSTSSTPTTPRPPATRSGARGPRSRW